MSERGRGEERKGDIRAKLRDGGTSRNRGREKERDRGWINGWRWDRDMEGRGDGGGSNPARVLSASG